MTFVQFKNRKMEPCNVTVFVFCINVKITGISSELTKISQKEFRVLFGPHVETTKLSDMSKRTVKQLKNNCPGRSPTYKYLSSGEKIVKIGPVDPEIIVLKFKQNWKCPYCFTPDY